MNNPFARRETGVIDPKAQTVELNNSLPKLGMKMFGSTIYATAFCVVVLVFMSFLINEGAWGAIVYQIVNLILYTPIVYMAAWRCGDRDHNYVHFQRMEEDSWRGVKIGLIAIAPYALCLLLLILYKAAIVGTWAAATVRIIYAPFVVVFNLLVPNMTADGGAVPLSDISYLGILLASLLQLYVPVVTGVGYRLGFKGVSLYQKLIYQNKKPGDAAKVELKK